MLAFIVPHTQLRTRRGSKTWIPKLHHLRPSQTPVARRVLPMATHDEHAAEKLAKQAEKLQLLITERASAVRECSILHYVPISSEAKRVHVSPAQQLLVVAGNRAGKTDTMLAELVIQLTGIVPLSLRDCYPVSKIRAPIRARLVVKSIINTWQPVMLPKLQWFQWNGSGEPGGHLGHWGWIPKHLLLKGEWSESWSEKHRTLTLANGSTLQIMSHENDIADFSGGSLHIVAIDEGIDSARYRENLLRIADVSGQIIMAMTPPDEEAASWDAAWSYDQLYQKGIEGAGKDPSIEAITLFTEQNYILDQQALQELTRGLTPAQREVRLRGRYLHLSGRIYKNFSVNPQLWCFGCRDIVYNRICGHENFVEFTHVIEPFDVMQWPVVFALDPHPRKPNCMAWFAVDPNDDLLQVAELEVDDDPAEVWKQVQKLERELKLNVRKRLTDPNMGESPSGVKRGVTVRQSFANVGLRCDLADDNRDTARTTIRAMLVPDGRLKLPRLRVFSTCKKTIEQFGRYSWDSWAKYSADRKDPKATPQDKFSDFPTITGYVVNSKPLFRNLNFQFSFPGSRPLPQASHEAPQWPMLNN